MNTEDIERATMPFIVIYFSKVFHHRLVQAGVFTLLIRYVNISYEIRSLGVWTNQIPPFTLVEPHWLKLSADSAAYDITMKLLQLSPINSCNNLCNLYLWI